MCATIIYLFLLHGLLIVRNRKEKICLHAQSKVHSLALLEILLRLIAANKEIHINIYPFIICSVI